MIRNEVGNQDIKSMRRRRMVPVPPGGRVADYVPFYYAPRSPMMYVIEQGGVSTYAGGCEELIYLVTTIERLAGLGVPLVFTDRNAALGIAEFTADPARLDSFIDWPLMQTRVWKNTDAQPDRKERRMAECLVYGRMPCDALTEIGTKTVACARQIRTMLATVDRKVPVVVRPGWYF